MMKQNSRPPTMKDVARAAGVSLGTVSRVFNGFTVGVDYRIRVEKAAQALGYEINSYARGLKTNRTNSAALLIPSLRHPFFAALTDEITACLAQHGYRTVLMITNFDPDAEQKCFALVRQNKVDGVIALSYSPDLNDLSDDLPIVTIDRHFNDRIPCVSSDNFHGGQLAAEKLITLGCRKLLFLRIGPELHGEADLRGPGFEEVCVRHGIDYRSLLVNDSETETPIYRFLEKHIRNGRLDYDGVFCNTDGLAMRVCAFLTDKGVRTPEDVQVIGYDGIVDFTSGSYLCSTIVQPVAEMAKTAVEILLSQEQAPDGSTHRLPVFYAPGGTTREGFSHEVSSSSWNPFGQRD